MVRLSRVLPLLLVGTTLGFAPQGASSTFGSRQQQSHGSVLHLSIGGTDVDPTVIAAVGVALIGGVGSAVLSSKIREMDEQEGGSAAGTTTTSAAAAPTPSSSSIDVSIPYDAAARLAYDKSGGSGDYEAFKTKYEADAVKEVIAKGEK